MGKLVNEFGWSSSRARTLADCSRAYFWSYYGSWGGWEHGAPKQTALAYRLKKLSNRWSWCGDIVHKVIRRAAGDYRAGRPVDAEALIAGARDQMRMEWKASNKGPRSSKNGRGFWGLLEHEYRDQLAPEDWAGIWMRTERCLRAFFGSRFPAYLAGLSANQWIELEGEDGPPPTFEIAGIRVYAIPDLVIHDDQGALVFDWKTGKAKQADRDQVLGYALYLQQRYGFPIEATRAVAVYLGNEAHEKMFATTPDQLDQYKARVIEETTHARAMLEDPLKNKPLPMNAFAQTEDLGTCRSCAFRRLCLR
jgi:hypothetical protein